MKIYLVVGVPASGKSWVCEQLTDRFKYIRHDDYMKGGYVEAIIAAAVESDKPLLIETPFSMSKIVDPLTEAGHDVTPVLVIESVSALSARYYARDQKEYPKGNVTRQDTFIARFKDSGHFFGSSGDVLAHLRAAGSF